MVCGCLSVDAVARRVRRKRDIQVGEFDKAANLLALCRRRFHERPFQTELSQVRHLLPLLEPQVSCNSAIAEEGLRGAWGAQIGRILLEDYGDDRLTVISCTDDGEYRQVVTGMLE